MDIEKTAKDFLSAHKKMALTVLDQEGAPNSSLVLYASDGLDIYFGSKRSFGKSKAIEKDPRVSAIVIEEGIDPLRVLDVQGRAVEVPAEELASRLEWFTQKNQSQYYVKGAEDYVMFKIVPTTARFADASSGKLEMHDLLHKN